MVFLELVKGMLVGIILVAAGVVMTSSDTNIPLLINVGWVFSIGGIAVIVLTIFSAIKR